MLKSPQAFQLYLTALLRTGQYKSFDPAVRRRDALLQATEPAALSTADTTASTDAPVIATGALSSTEKTTLAGDSQSQLVGPSDPVPTSSRAIALAVLSGEAQTPSILPSNAKRLEALSADVGGAPIQVSIVERRVLFSPQAV